MASSGSEAKALAQSPVHRASALGGDLAPSESTGAWGYCLRVFLIVRSTLLLLGVLGRGLFPSHHSLGVPGWAAPRAVFGWTNAVTAWEHADALWFLRIASHGYSARDGSPAFFPLFPLLVRWVGLIFASHWLLASFVVSNIALLVGLVLVYRLSELEFSTLVARRTVLYMALFPTAFFFFSPFSESLFLALSAGAFLAARQKRWWLAGICGALGAATRSIGVVVIAPLALEAILQYRESAGSSRRPARLAGNLAWSALPGAGAGAYLLYWKVKVGDWLVPFRAQSGWLRTFTWPWHALEQGTRLGLRYLGVYPGAYWTVDLILVAVAIAGAIWVIGHARPTFGIYCAISIVLWMVLVFPTRPFLSDPRFILPLFPVFWALARFSERWHAHEFVVAASAAGLALLGVAFMTSYPIF